MIMKNVSIPEGYQQIMPYLIIKDANGFLDFTKFVFDAEEKFMQMRDENTIMHGEVQIGTSVIMFADSTAEFPPQTAGIFVYVDNADEVFRKALEEGAVGIMDIADQSYGRCCGVQDPFGNTWWITSDLN
jgi:PhnB protein